MRILQISTYDIRGGAARATHRLHRGLCELGEDCRMLVRHKDSNDPSISCVVPENPAEKVDEEFFLSVAIQQHYINLHRTDISNTLFSLPYPGYDLSALPMVQEADIINLHWVANYQSPLTLHKLFALGKPVVWTLHDHWAFTGGCHYTAGCEEYRHGCAACPQLADDPFGVPEAVLKDKLKFFKDANLTIVTPSQWMADCAKESKLFKDLRIEVIPNALETDVFRPLPKAEAKKSIGLTPDIITLLFGGEYGNEKRKGFHELIRAIEYCLKDDDFANLIKAKKIRLICFGYASDEFEAVGIPVEALGYLDSDEKIMTAYCAADIFVLPSLEDNLPNTMLEAMSCGTPVVAFDVGGMPDVVRDGVTGRLVPLGNVREMGKAILSLILDGDKRKAMGKKCRRRMEEGYLLDVQARRYLGLYEDLDGRATRKSGSGPVGSDIVKLSRQYHSIGPNFHGIYEGVLFKALKSFSISLAEDYADVKKDRDLKARVVERLESQLAEIKQDQTERLKLIEDLSQRLEVSELDRSARLEVIEDLSHKLQKSEAELAASLEVIKSQELVPNRLPVKLLRRLKIG